MKILDNAILGKNFRLSNMKLNDNGLFKVITGRNNEPFEIFLTDNPAEICELMYINFEDIDKTGGNKSFELLLDSPYFNNYIFFTGYEKSKLLTLFYNYLTENEVVIDKTYKRITKTRVNDVLNINLHKIIEEKLNILLNFDKKDYSGLTIKEYAPDVDLRNYFEYSQRFYNSFENDFAFKTFIVENNN